MVEPSADEVQGLSDCNEKHGDAAEGVDDRPSAALLDTIKATAIINDLIDQIVSLIKIGPHICEGVSFARI